MVERQMVVTSSLCLLTRHCIAQQMPPLIGASEIQTTYSQPVQIINGLQICHLVEYSNAVRQEEIQGHGQMFTYV